jgi:hypothetical protein
MDIILMKSIEFKMMNPFLCYLRFGTVFICCMFLMLASGSTKSQEWSSTPVENVRQIGSFLQNEPNFPHFSPKNEDFIKKRTQANPMLIWAIYFLSSLMTSK